VPLHTRERDTRHVLAYLPGPQCGASRAALMAITVAAAVLGSAPARAEIGWVPDGPTRSSADSEVAGLLQEHMLPPDPSDPSAWTTHAHGDEVLVLAVNPADAMEVWAGTEGGGVIIWRAPDVEPSRKADAARASADGGASLPTLAAPSFRQHIYPGQPGLASNTVYDIAFESDGASAWLATEGGLTHATARGAWRAWREEPGMPPDAVYTAVAVGSDGTVWAGTAGNGMVARAPDGAWRTIAPDSLAIDAEELRSGPGADHIADIAVAPDGSVWVVHGRGSADRPAFSRYAPEFEAWFHVLDGGPRADPATRPRTHQIMALDFDGDGVLWAATWGRGVVSFDGEVWTEHGEDAGVCDSTVWAVHAADDGTIWIACGESSREVGHGVARWDGDAWAILDSRAGLPSEVVTTIASGGGRILLGTDGPSVRPPWAGEGIVPLRFGAPGTAPTVEPAWLTTSAGILPPVNEITALHIDATGTVWAGTRGEGLLVRSADAASGGDRWSRLTRSADGLAGDHVSDIVSDGERVWVASTSFELESGVYVDGGVSLVSPADLEVDRTAVPAPGGVRNGQVSSLAPLPDGSLALGLGAGVGGVGRNTHDGRGVAIFDPDAETWRYDDRRSTEGGLIGDTVLDLAVRGDELWAAASYARDPEADMRQAGGGVARYLEGAWSGWAAGDAGFVAYSEGLIGGDVRTLHVPPPGSAGAGAQVWAGTWFAEPGGLIGAWPFVDAVAEAFDGRRWDGRRFGGDGWVSAIGTDATGRLWAATTRGHLQEEWPGRGVRGLDDAGFDRALGGIHVYEAGSGWRRIDPRSSGLSARAVTALAIHPHTGDVWVGTESGGIAVFKAAPRPIVGRILLPYAVAGEG